MAASTTLPLLFLSLPSGALADLANRRNVLLATQFTMLASVLGMTGFALADAITPPLLLAFGLLLGVGVGLQRPGVDGDGPRPGAAGDGARRRGPELGVVQRRPGGGPGARAG